MILISEKDDTGATLSFELDPNTHQIVDKNFAGNPAQTIRPGLTQALAKAFLPAGYPQNVTDDYLQYQIFNALQAFCSSLASLIASRATLEAFGVGDESASATSALLLSVSQDALGRLATIIGGLYLGTSLVPEAKVFRFLADILNDGAIALDSISPLLKSLSLPLLPSPTLRILALCTSGVLRAVCGVCAGGSKAALTLHFATPPGSGSGDVGDLNAKDGSKETVLSLAGMLLGTLIVPYLKTRWSTYTVLFMLLACHLVLNYVAISRVALRSLNRRRAQVQWATYRASLNGGPAKAILTPAQMAQRDSLLPHVHDLFLGQLRESETGDTIGSCAVGSALSDVLAGKTMSNKHGETGTERMFAPTDEAYILCADADGRLHICLRDGYGPRDILKAWVHGYEAAHAIYKDGVSDHKVKLTQANDVLERSFQIVSQHFPGFIRALESNGWNADESAILIGAPKAVLTGMKKKME